MSAIGFLAVGIGAAIGAWLRWWLGIVFNPVFPTLPLGTLAANLLGGYLVGVAVAFFSQHAGHTGFRQNLPLFSCRWHG